MQKKNLTTYWQSPSDFSHVCICLFAYTYESKSNHYNLHVVCSDIP